LKEEDGGLANEVKVIFEIRNNR